MGIAGSAIVLGGAAWPANPCVNSGSGAEISPQPGVPHRPTLAGEVYSSANPVDASIDPIVR